LIQLFPPKLETPKDAKITYCIGETGSFLVGDIFLSGYLADCLYMAEGLGHVHKILLSQKAAELKTSQETLSRLMAQADDNIRWAKQMREENYHRVHTLAFLSEWAAQEAGNENVIAAILSTIESAAQAAIGKFAKGRYGIGDWPWSDEKCLEIAQKLDQKAKEKTPDGGWDIANRIVILFGWLGVSVSIDSQTAAIYNEASMIRNVIVHRYGRLGPSEIARAPHFSEWVGRTAPMTRERLGQYHTAIVGLFLAIFQGIRANGWK
jgi:hypothetical protein